MYRGTVCGPHILAEVGLCISLFYKAFGAT